MFHTEGVPYIVGRYRLQGTRLGKGNYATVEQAVHMDLETNVAIKMIDTRAVHDQYVLRNLHREAAVLRRLKHPNILAIFEALRAGDLYCIATELVAGGELVQYVSKQPGGRLDENATLLFGAQLVSALAHMHERGVVHRDLKMKNIMLTRGCDAVKIVDFGLSNTWSPSAPLRTHCGSPGYAAPEIYMHNRPYGPEVDLWSLGVVLFGMAVGRLPFHLSRDRRASPQERRQRLLAQLLRGATEQHVAAMAHCSPSFRDLVQGLLTAPVSRRLTLKQTLEHPWVARRLRSRHMLTAPYRLSGKEHALILTKLAVMLNMSVEAVRAHCNRERLGEVAAMYNILAHKQLSHYHAAWGRCRLRFRGGDPRWSPLRVSVQSRSVEDLRSIRAPPQLLALCSPSPIETISVSSDQLINSKDQPHRESATPPPPPQSPPPPPQSPPPPPQSPPPPPQSPPPPPQSPPPTPQNSPPSTKSPPSNPQSPTPSSETPPPPPLPPQPPHSPPPIKSALASQTGLPTRTRKAVSFSIIGTAEPDDTRTCASRQDTSVQADLCGVTQSEPAQRSAGAVRGLPLLLRHVSPEPKKSLYEPRRSALRSPRATYKQIKANPTLSLCYLKRAAQPKEPERVSSPESAPAILSGESGGSNSSHESTNTTTHTEESAQEPRGRDTDLQFENAENMRRDLEKRQESCESSASSLRATSEAATERVEGQKRGRGRGRMEPPITADPDPSPHPRQRTSHPKPRIKVRRRRKPLPPLFIPNKYRVDLALIMTVERSRKFLLLPMNSLSKPARRTCLRGCAKEVNTNKVNLQNVDRSTPRKKQGSFTTHPRTGTMNDMLDHKLIGPNKDTKPTSVL